jgi:uncharacterized protein (DUF934 family)
MPLLEDGNLAADSWQSIGDGEEIAGGDIIVPLARFVQERATLLACNGRLGVHLRNTDPVVSLVADLARLDLIALEFPKFTDGRAYSQARLLRERHGYRGRLRATGQVLIDQYLLMRRCGFDSFEILRPVDAEAWREAEARFSAFYQPTGDGRQPIDALRRNLRRTVASASTRSVGNASATPAACSGDVNASASIRRGVRRPALPDDAAICTIAAK